MPEKLTQSQLQDVINFAENIYMAEKYETRPFEYVNNILIYTSLRKMTSESTSS